MFINLTRKPNTIIETRKKFLRFKKGKDILRPYYIYCFASVETVNFLNHFCFGCEIMRNANIKNLRILISLVAIKPLKNIFIELVPLFIVAARNGATVFLIDFRIVVAIKKPKHVGLLNVCGNHDFFVLMF